jgi:hypothetical protein
LAFTANTEKYNVPKWSDERGKVGHTTREVSKTFRSIFLIGKDSLRSFNFGTDSFRTILWEIVNWTYSHNYYSNKMHAFNNKNVYFVGVIIV